MLGIDERSPRSSASRAANRVLVLEPANDALGIEPLLLTPGQHTFGSSSGNTFVLSVPGVAEQHCVINVRGNVATATAVDRRCWINNGPLLETRLRTGDRLVVGPVQFRVGEMSQAADASPGFSTQATDEGAEASRNEATTPTRRDGRRRPSSDRSRPSKVRRPSPAAEEPQSERLTAPSELEVRIQQRLAATSQLVDSLLAIDADEPGGTPAAHIDTSHLVPEHRSEFVLKLLDSVHQRAGELVGREQIIAAKERELAIEGERIQREREAVSRAHSELADHREQSRRQREALDRLRDELAAERRQIDRDHRDAETRTRESERVLRDAQDAAESFQREARQRDESLTRREQAAAACDEASCAREHQLDEREHDIARRLDVVAQKERAAVECMHDAASREQAVAERASGIAEREQSVCAQEQSIREREQRSDERDRQLADREQALAAREAEFADQQRLAADRERDLSVKSREVDERASAVASRESAVSEQEQAISARLLELNGQAQSLSQREQELDRLRNELASEVAEIAARRQALSEREAQLDQQARQADELAARLASEKDRLAADTEAACRLRDATRGDFDELWPALDRGLRTLAHESRAVGDAKASLANAQHECALWMEQRTAIEQEHQRIRDELDARQSQQSEEAEQRDSINVQRQALEAQRLALDTDRQRLAERESALASAQCEIDSCRAQIDELRAEVERQRTEVAADRERLRAEIEADRERIVAERAELARSVAAESAPAVKDVPESEPAARVDNSCAFETVDEAAASDDALSERWKRCEEAWSAVQEETWRIVAEEQRLERESGWLRAEMDRLSEESAACGQRRCEMDAAAANLDAWSVDLDETSESIVEQSDELARREQVLSERQAEYDRRSDEFNDAALRLARHHTMLERRELDLSVRDAVLAARSETLDERARELDALSESIVAERAGCVPTPGESDEPNASNESAMIQTQGASWSPDGLASRADEALDDAPHAPGQNELLRASEPCYGGLQEREESTSDVAEEQPAPWTSSQGQPLDFDSRSIYQPGAMDAAAEFRRMASGAIDDHRTGTVADSENTPPADFRLLDMNWFTDRQASEDSAEAEDGADVGGSAAHGSFGDPRLSDYGVVEDDRVAAFLRARDSASIVPDNDRLDDVSELASDEAEAGGPDESPEDERVRSLRSQLAAMFDVSPEALRSRQKEDRSVSDDDGSHPSVTNGSEDERWEEAGDHESSDADEEEAEADRNDDGEAGATGINFGLLTSSCRMDQSTERGSREPEAANAAPAVVRHGTKEREVAVNDIEDANSVAAYMERLFARNRQQTGGYGETDLTPPRSNPEPPPAPRAAAAEEIVVPAYVPGMENEVVPPEEQIAPRGSVDPVHRQDKDAVRAHLDSLRKVANHSARTAIAQHTWKQFRVMVWLKVVLLVGSAALSICLLSDSLLGKLDLKATGWSLAGISLIVAASFAHSFGEVRRSTRQQSKRANRRSERASDKAASTGSDDTSTEEEAEESSEQPH